MCRLYGFHSNEPTRIECPLVFAQNALMMQSMEDTSGGSHTHGWGIAAYKDGFPQVERRAWPAYHGEHFVKAAAAIYSTTVLAHVRHATVGEAAMRNTHPFIFGKWAFAHNGTVPGFQKFKEKMIGEISENFRSQISGETDSEHIFYLFLTYCQLYSQRTVIENLREVIQKIYQWSRACVPDGVMGLNLLLTDGKKIYGSRIGRSLYYTQHEGIYNCEICGFPHVHHLSSVDYRAIDIASEAITHDEWTEMPEQSLFYVEEDFTLHKIAL